MQFSTLSSQFSVLNSLLPWANNLFDISTGTDLKEVDNATNQARKEIRQRYDFKGAPTARSIQSTRNP